MIYGTQGYLVNTQTLTLDKINKFYPITSPYDIAVAKILKTYILEPKIVELSEYASKSDTQGLI